MNHSAYFDKKGLITIDYEIGSTIDLITIDASTADFDRFMPDFEGKFTDDDGNYTALFDHYGNLHWLIEDFEGFIHYRVKNCNNIIHEIIQAKIQR